MKLKQAILSYDAKAATKAAEEAVGEKIDLKKLLNVATEALRELGMKFSQGEIFLPHLVMAADAMESATKVFRVLMPKGKKIGHGKIVIGVVEGDMHDIGKSIVSALLKSAGFEVYDVGRDISAEKFIEKAEEVGADIIASSALMTVTMPKQKELEGELRRLGLKEKYKTIVGGGPVTPEWAKEIGAEGFGRTAFDAVKIVEELLGKGG